MSLGWMVDGLFFFVCLLVLLILFPLVGCFVDLLPQTLQVGTFPYTFLVQSFLAAPSSSTGKGAVRGCPDSYISYRVIL